MHTRADLVDYLCNQQHSSRILSGAVPWKAVSPEQRAADRAAMRVVLEELEDLGLLVSSRVPA